jgi:predicted PurR-regulated permease PerM
MAEPESLFYIISTWMFNKNLMVEGHPKGKFNMTQRLIQQRIFFFIMVGILAFLALILLWQFVTPILLAFAVVVIMKPVYTWLLGKKWIKGSETRATGVTMLIFVLVIAIPVVLIIGGAITQAGVLFSGLDLGDLNLSVPEILAWLEDNLRGIGAGEAGIDRAQISEGIQQAVNSLGEWLMDLLVSLGESLIVFITNALIVLVILYVMLPRYKRPGKQDILDIVPYPPEITQLFLDKIDLMITAMFKGLFVIAIVQGLAMGVVLWIAGVPFVMFFTLLSMFLSLVPFIGISLVAWPLGILLILTGNIWQGIFVIVAFLLIVANIDTILRPVLIPKEAYLNPALVILSVFGGLGVMGFVGIIYGPVIMILLVTSIEVYSKYLLRPDLETLEKEGRINLEELGLAHAVDEQEKGISNMFVTALKHISAGFRKESQKPEPTGNPDTPNL